MTETLGNVGGLLADRVAESPDRVFLISETDGRAYSFREFDFAVNHAARLLLGLGVVRGDRVSLLMTNRVEYLVFYFACFRIGAWAGPVNASLKPREIQHVLNDSGACVVVTQSDLLPTLTRVAMPEVRAIVLVDSGVQEGGNEIERDLVAFELPDSPGSGEPLSIPVEPVLEDEAVIIYTSGTTGRPKGVLLTHGNLLTNAREIADWLSLSSDDRAHLIMPLFHVNALMTTGLAALWAGGNIVLSPRFSSSRHWDVIREYGVTYFGSVPTMLAILNAAWTKNIQSSIAGSRLRFALCGSAPVPLEVIRRFEELFARPVIEGYGLSESTCRATFNPPDERRRPGSVGLPIGNEIRVVDDQDKELPPGEIGEIVLRGANIMKGYYRNESATREAFRSGWFHTGDLGFVDEDGYFHIVDRKGDMIIRGGENIYPREIDEVLYQHSAVRDAATIGVPDAIYGEEVLAFVTPRGPVTAEDLISYCKSRLADFKCPKSIVFVESIPKGPTGKLLKRELQEQLKRAEELKSDQSS